MESKEKTVERASANTEVLTLNQVAAELQVCRKTIEKYVLTKELRVTRLGRRILVRREQLRKFLDKHTR